MLQAPGLAERRHRHVAATSASPAAPSSRTSSSTTASRARRSSTRRPATSTARTPRRSSCRPAWRTSRSSASSRAATRPSSAPAPAARSASSPSRAATQFRGSLFEYLRSDKLDAPNHFDSPRNPDDSIIARLPKSLLKQNQFGGSIGGPIMKDRAFFFGSYEGYRLDAGKNFVEAVPSAAAWARAVPAVAGAAARLPGARARSSCRARPPNPDFDIAQLQATQDVTRELLQRPLRLQDQRQLVDLRPRLPRPGHERRARRASPAAASTSPPTRPTRCSTCRACSAAARSTSSSSATTPRRRTDRRRRPRPASRTSPST